MHVTPVIRYMILCENWMASSTPATQVNVLGLLSSIRSLEEPAFPILRNELCVLLIMTEGRGNGEVEIRCVFDDDMNVFGSPKRRVVFGNDPLEVVAVGFRIRDCFFPCAGLYSVQFWYNQEKVAECPLRLR